MRKCIFEIILSTILLFSCDLLNIGSGNLVQEDRAVSTFDSIELDGVGHVYIQQSETSL
jgi:hypothetical protein